jgi:hypothetical protein
LTGINFKLKTIRIIGFSYLAITILVSYQKTSITKDLILAIIYLPLAIYIVAMVLYSLQINEINKHLATISFYLCLLPMLSFATGRIKAINIENNYKYTYSLNVVSGDTLKYLGKASDNYIFTNMKNSKNYIIKTI